LSANIHGITSDFPLIHSLVSFSLITLSHQGGEGEGEGGKEGLAPKPVILTCSREENRELFKLCCGGFGLFGVIWDAKFKVRPNLRVVMDSFHLKPEDFLRIYDGLLNSDKVVMKLARIDITNFDWIALYAFPQESDFPSISALPIKPREMGQVNQLLYKWLVGPLREIRFMAERSLGRALDWSGVLEQNQLLFESAVPLARLYSPLLKFDDTFLLQEYFIPKENFPLFYEDLKGIVLDKIDKEKNITLLNITIRFVKQDQESFLPYAPRDSFAFVLYYRLHRTPECDAQMSEFHDLLAEAAMRSEGTFYLPYRHHYSLAQLERSYPAFKEFVEAKKRFDPHDIYNNLWFADYAQRLQENQQGSSRKKEKEEAPQPPSSHLTFAQRNLSEEEREAGQKEALDLVRGCHMRREGSFRALVNNHSLRKAFMEGFLVEVFNVVSPTRVSALITSACWDIRNKNDLQIYSAIQEQANADLGGPLSQLSYLLSSLKQVGEQRAELVREVLSILSKIGGIGSVNSYASIGDNGKLCLDLKEVLEMKGRILVVHDQEVTSSNFVGILERGSLDPVGDFVKIDYSNIREKEFPTVESETLDLVTMNQGLHHLPLEGILPFLKGVFRILRPGGFFIVREHDASKELLSTLDCAHMIFNALTNVSFSSELHEIRGFRPILEWRRIIESVGFIDSMVYEMQPNDPTLDIMMCFVKPKDSGPTTPSPPSPSPPSPSSPRPKAIPIHAQESLATEEDLHRSGLVEELLDPLPAFALENGVALVQLLTSLLPTIGGILQKALGSALSQVPGLGNFASKELEKLIEPLISMLQRFEPMFQRVRADMSQSEKNRKGKPQVSGAKLLPKELFLIIPIMRMRVKEGKNASVLESVVLEGVDRFMKSLNKSKESKPAQGKKVVQRTSSSEIRWQLEEKTLMELINSLLKAIPSLNNLPQTVRDSGLPPMAIQTLLEVLTPEKLEELKQWIISNCDKRTFEEVSHASEKIISEKSSPTMERVLEKGNAWNLFFKALLGCPYLRFSWAQLAMLSCTGLKPLVDLFHDSQSERKRHIPHRSTTMKPREIQEVEEHLRQLMPKVTKEIDLSKVKDLTHVALPENVILKARSLTGMFEEYSKDLTSESLELFDPKTATWKLSRLPPQVTGRLGNHYLVVEYRQIFASTSSSSKDPIFHLVEKLGELGLVDTESRKENWDYSFMKLPEWMQAEMVLLLGNSLDHTPFYRFPFMGTLKTFFEVFMGETLFVAEEKGMFSTLISQAWITDFVGSVITSLLFGILQTVSLPIKSTLGETYPHELLNETLLLVGPTKLDFKEIPGVLKSEELCPGLYQVTIETFKGFTKSLLHISTAVPLAQLLRISNNLECQVRFEIQTDEEERILEAQPGCRKVSFLLLFFLLKNTKSKTIHQTSFKKQKNKKKTNERR